MQLHIIKLFRHLCLIALFIGGLPGPVFAAGDSAGIVTKVRGQVTARKTGDEKAVALRAGNALLAGQILQAAKGSAAQLVLTDDSVIHLLPGATLQVGQYSFSADENRRSAVIKLIEGSARFIVYKRRSTDSRFAVLTDQVQIGVGLADFILKISGNATEVANIGPLLGVANTSRLVVGRVQLGTNQRSTITEKEPPSQPAAITPEEQRKYLKDAEI